MNDDKKDDLSKYLTETIERLLGNKEPTPVVVFMFPDYAESLCRVLNKTMAELNMRAVTDEELHQTTNIFEKEDENS